MAVKNAVTNVKTLLADFRASLADTEYEGLLPDPVSTIRTFRQGSRVWQSCK